MHITNYIESQYREVLLFENIEYLDLYKTFDNEKLRIIFSTLHNELLNNFKLMNERLPTNSSGAHFWADPSRALSKAIDILDGLLRALNGSDLSFEVDSYYSETIEKCKLFLKVSGGSTIPPNMEKITLYYTIPIFVTSTNTRVKNPINSRNYKLKKIGEGSYANVYMYLDEHYDKPFVLKRAKKDLIEKELDRFKQEFSVMKSCNYPYIVDVYSYNEEETEYLMEYMDYTLQQFIQKNNDKLSISQRKKIGYQIIKGFDYIHKKNLLHRDISPKNILINIHDDIIIAKVSDFGLVKNPENEMTSLNTEVKGYFNDPYLHTEGFINYNMYHETYAITRLLYFVLTGKTNLEKIDERYKAFVSSGLSTSKDERYKNCDEILIAFRTIE